MYSDTNGVRLVSRNGNTFKSFPGLCEGLARDLTGHRCVLDGEIVCLPQFPDLLFRRGEPLFYAFDILWDEHAFSDDEEEMRRFRNGDDVRYLPLIDRKLRLHAMVPKTGERLLSATTLPKMARVCSGSHASTTLEGIVAKRKSDPYLPEHATWLKIRNHNYSQWAGREELFERERGSDPDFQVWDQCALVCETADM